jgi:hypothetical protein
VPDPPQNIRAVLVERVGREPLARLVVCERIHTIRVPVLQGMYLWELLFQQARPGTYGEVLYHRTEARTEAGEVVFSCRPDLRLIRGGRDGAN